MTVSGSILKVCFGEQVLTPALLIEVGCLGYPGASTYGTASPQIELCSMAGKSMPPRGKLLCQGNQAPVTLTSQWKKRGREGGMGVKTNATTLQDGKMAGKSLQQ